MTALPRSAYDVIVVGGGPAGATAAILLARASQRVAVVEKAVFPRRKVCGEFISATTWPLLQELGVADALKTGAGPPVRRVGIFAEAFKVMAPMPRQLHAPDTLGRAVGREILDAVLLDRASVDGATLWQPWTLVAAHSGTGRHACVIEHRDGHSRHVLEAPLLIAAHGSWEAGPLPTQGIRSAARASDLLGFKARFRGATLAPDLMPLIAFPGGYGGMVNTGQDELSLSFCVRRDLLAACRTLWPEHRAGDAVLAHILAHCHGAAEALSLARREGPWLAAGPMRTGIHSFGGHGIFAVGNAAAEAHPVVAEGISIAIQSSALLCEALRPHGGQPMTSALLEAVHRHYAQGWRHNFLLRMRASAIYAHLFMRPALTRRVMPLVARFPQLLRLGAGWSGKAHRLHQGGRETTRIPTGHAGEHP